MDINSSKAHCSPMDDVNLPQRKIIHVDFDAFYASIEIRDNPKLQGLPIAVGGDPAHRGVIATCSYEARRFGIHSAMASSHALRLCPSLRIITPRFAAYKEASAEARAIFAKYTDLIEPLSLDEAYLDVTHATAFRGSATLIANAIRQEIEQTLHVTASAGVAPNKFLAKVASDWNKPNGTFVITPNEVLDFLFELPVKKIPGVGKVTADKLKKRGIETCGQIRDYSMTHLTRWFGSFGESLWHMAHGIDNRPVVSHRRRKSLSVEHTFDRDLTTKAQVLEKLPLLIAEFSERLARLDNSYQPTKRIVKVKFSDFTQTTLEESIVHHLTASEQFEQMILAARQRQAKNIRLLGVGVKLNDQSGGEHLQQLLLF